jgi:hypothetical protein
LGLRHLPPYQAISLALLISTILDKYKLLSFSFIVLYLIVWIRKKKKKKKHFSFVYTSDVLELFEEIKDQWKIMEARFVPVEI